MEISGKSAEGSEIIISDVMIIEQRVVCVGQMFKPRLAAKDACRLEKHVS
jgi:hypothetical protein